MQKRKEQDRQREKERRKQADIASQEQEQHKGKLEQASQARVECAVKAANDKHWSALFPNPQLGARHIVAYLGPTNSGKTWHALQALRGLRPHEHGVYLAPLRLLAIEVCEELRAQGVAASLITGEEQDRVPNANVVCSTIEMLDPQQHYAVAVIDEMQMIADIQRGWAWTQALFEMSADQLFVLGSPSVEPLLLDFAKSAGDSLTIHPTKRFTPLHLAEKPTLPKQVPPHSIYVVFSRNAVIRWSEYFRSNGHTVASIYGAMPPEVRREEARRFRCGEAEILMATDAVAMGLNLPAQQVIIGEGEKYDGTSMIPIPPSLLRQIAGRAGRYGHHEFGMAAGSDSAIHKLLGKALSGQDSPITFPDVMVAPTRHWVAQAVDTVPDLSTEELLRAWKHTVSGSAWFRSTDLDESRQKGHLLDQIEGARSLSMAERLQIIAAPVDAFNGNHLAYFRSLAQSVIAGNPMVAPHPAASSARTDELESAYKQLSLYCWFHYRYPAICPDIASAIASRRKCVDLLIAHVRNGIKRHCDRCGKILVSSSTYRICEGCYQRQRRGYGNEWDD